MNKEQAADGMDSSPSPDVFDACSSYDPSFKYKRRHDIHNSHSINNSRSNIDSSRNNDGDSVALTQGCSIEWGETPSGKTVNLKSLFQSPVADASNANANPNAAIGSTPATSISSNTSTSAASPSTGQRRGVFSGCSTITTMMMDDSPNYATQPSRPKSPSPPPSLVGKEKRVVEEVDYIYSMLAKDQHEEEEKKVDLETNGGYDNYKNERSGGGSSGGSSSSTPRIQNGCTKIGPSTTAMPSNEFNAALSNFPNPGPTNFRQGHGHVPKMAGASHRKRRRQMMERKRLFHSSSSSSSYAARIAKEKRRKKLFRTKDRDRSKNIISKQGQKHNRKELRVSSAAATTNMGGEGNVSSFDDLLKELDEGSGSDDEEEEEEYQEEEGEELDQGKRMRGINCENGNDAFQLQKETNAVASDQNGRKIERMVHRDRTGTCQSARQESSLQPKVTNPNSSNSNPTIATNVASAQHTNSTNRTNITTNNNHNKGNTNPRKPDDDFEDFDFDDDLLAQVDAAVSKRQARSQSHHPSPVPAPTFIAASAGIRQTLSQPLSSSNPSHGGVGANRPLFQSNPIRLQRSPTLQTSNLTSSRRNRQPNSPHRSSACSGMLQEEEKENSTFLTYHNNSSNINSHRTTNSNHNPPVEKMSSGMDEDDDFDDFGDMDFDQIDQLIAQHQVEKEAVAHILPSQYQSQNSQARAQMHPSIPSGPEFITCTRYRICAIQDDPNNYQKVVGVSVYRPSDVNHISDQDGNQTETINAAHTTRDNPGTICGYLYLRDEWYYTRCDVGDIVHVCSLNGRYDTSSGSLPLHLNSSEEDDIVLILHPDDLVTPTTVSEAVSCSRRAVLKTRYGSSGLTCKYI